VAALVEKALSKLREDRFQTATEFREAVRRCQRDCAATDSHAPTMILHRRAHHQGVGRRVEPRPSGGRAWDVEIDDPETFIDDDQLDEPALSSGDEQDTHREVGLPVATLDSAMGSDDGVVEPLEPTIQDRIPDFSNLGDSDASQSSDADDTEVMKRRAPVPPIREPTPSSTATTDVIDRDALLAQRHVSHPSRPQVPRPTRRRRLHRPPPLPGYVSDDDPTTLYDIDAARAKLRARRLEAERAERAERAQRAEQADDDYPEDGNR
jgi:hypothetical protein